MGRKALIAAISVTILLAVVVFVAMWIVRPETNSMSNALLKRVEERQSIPLIELTEPVNMSINEITQEERLAISASEEVINNPTLLNAIAERVIELLPTTVTKSELNKAVIDLKADIESEIESSETEAASYTDSSISTLNRQLRSYILQEIQRSGVESLPESSESIDLSSFSMEELTDALVSSPYFNAALDRALRERNLARIPDSPSSLSYSTSVVDKNDRLP